MNKENISKKLILTFIAGILLGSGITWIVKSGNRTSPQHPDNTNAADELRIAPLFAENMEKLQIYRTAKHQKCRLAKAWPEPVNSHFSFFHHTEREWSASYLKRSGKCFIAEWNGAASSSGVFMKRTCRCMKHGFAVWSGTLCHEAKPDGFIPPLKNKSRTFVRLDIF